MASYQLKELNRRAAADPKDFLGSCDRDFQRKLREGAAQIAGNLKESPVVLLSGPSGSGKTTTAMKLRESLETLGVRCHTISLDNYFRTVAPETSPKLPNGEYDFESPFCLDLELLDEHFSALGRGEEILIPHFDFSRKMRDTSRVTPLKLGADEAAIFEGIHALNDLITASHPEAFKIYLSARSDVLDDFETVFKSAWVRLTRRAVRDYNFRSTSAAETLRLWYNVRRGEKAYISPFKDKANLQLDSFLPYELNVLRHYAQPLFEAVPASAPRREELLGMITAFDRFVPISPELVAEDSLIREFIGGGSYHY